MTKEEAIELNNQFQAAKLALADFAEPMEAIEQDLAKQIEAVKTKWAESNAELIKNFGEAKSKTIELEASVREAVVKLYEAQEDKTIKSGTIPGWGVQVGTKLEYDPAKAIAWAVEHKHLGLLKIDPTAFKKLAEVTKPDFVTFKEEPSARIDTKKGK